MDESSYEEKHCSQCSYASKNDIPPLFSNELKQLNSEDAPTHPLAWTIEKVMFVKKSGSLSLCILDPTLHLDFNPQKNV